MLVLTVCLADVMKMDRSITHSYRWGGLMLGLAVMLLSSASVLGDDPPIFLSKTDPECGGAAAPETLVGDDRERDPSAHA